MIGRERELETGDRERERELETGDRERERVGGW